MIRGDEIEWIGELMEVVPKMGALEEFRLELRLNPSEKLGFEAQNFESLEAFRDLCREYYK